jgi:singapore isolate B (sub-type 7) whole genome shotgun sequence assembly, scaffold_3
VRCVEGQNDKKNGVTSLDLCIFDLITTPRHFASGSILLLTQLSEEMEEQKIWVGESVDSFLEKLHADQGHASSSRRPGGELGGRERPLDPPQHLCTRRGGL